MLGADVATRGKSDEHESYAGGDVPIFAIQCGSRPESIQITRWKRIQDSLS